MLDDLTTFIRSNPDPRELKRAIAVQMWNKGYKHQEIQDSLSVSSGFISKWTQRYEKEGILSLKLAHRGSTGYLDSEQRTRVIQWIQAKDAWHLSELQIYLEDEYEVVFKSKQSYYDLLSEAGLSWKKTQKRNPKTDPEIVKKKTTELTDWLEERREQIESGKLAVFFQDECHLLWGDLCGYVWGKTDERVEIPMQNQKERQTYFGAVNLATGQCLVQPQPTGNGICTIAYLQYLMDHCPEQRIALIWDGAGYHRSDEMKAFLSSINDGLAEADWKITCLRFAPNDPTQNPIEDIWLAAKRYIREFYHQCKTFASVKQLFELAVQYKIFDFPKLHRLGEFSLIT